MSGLLLCCKCICDPSERQIHYGSLRFISEKCIFAAVENKPEHIEALKKAVVSVFGQTLDSPTDYERLSADIQKRTGELISVSTLKRLFGYIKSGTAPRPSTLSALARYAGSSGWSDFCSKCAKEADPEPRKDSAKPVYRHPIVYIAVVILCIGGVFGLAVWGPDRENANGTRSNKKERIPIAASGTEETDEQKYERLLLSFVALTNAKCDSIRACRQSMDIISYKELVDSVYYPFVFTFLQDSIKRQTERIFPEDELLRVRYGNDIWEQCRELCADLMREIPAEELLKAYNQSNP